jgi:glucarate dehydratase
VRWACFDEHVKISEIRITPVAIKDPPLRNVHGVHQPYALRVIIEVVTDEGLVGLGETYGGAAHLDRLRAAVPALLGKDPFDINGLERAITGATSGVLAGKDARVLAAFEVPFWDLEGKAAGRPVADLLGGRCRDAVPYSAYLFFKLARHPEDPGYPADSWGQALDAAGIVAQARAMVARYGFGSLKLKGGVLPPMGEAEAIEALREAFPEHPLRLDPNCGWTVPTSVDVGRRLEGVLEYLEDPTPTIAGMAQVARQVALPLATNMCEVEFAHLPPAIAAGAVQVVLSDHHYWGGLRRSQSLAAICETFGLGLSMHSNSHLGISLAAMTHLAAATPNLTYDCDTHTPWQQEDVIEPGVLRFVGGAVPVPTGPGLGVTLDRDALGRLHEQYVRCGIRERDDVTPMRAIDPAWDPHIPRW